MKKRLQFLFLTLTLAMTGSAGPSTYAFGGVLSLSEYQNQVLGKSAGIESSRLSTEGTLEASKEGELVFAPNFFSSYTYSSDSKEAANAFSGSKSVANEFKVGVQKQFDFGLSTTLSHRIVKSEIFDFPAAPSGVLRNNVALTSLEMSQSLWKNFLGKQTRATSTAAEASALATHFNEKIKYKQALAGIETTYHRLALAREAVRLQKEVFERAQKILDWATRRARNQLADKTDMLQAKAAYQAREIELLAQQEEERSARIQFNSTRNIDSEIVDEELSSVSYDLVANLAPIKKSENPDTVRAAEEGERAVTASNELSRQSSLPDLSVFGTLGLNGLDQAHTSTAVGEALTTAHPLYVVGVKFTTPLYFMDSSEARSGRVKQQLAAEANTRQKKIEISQGWTELTQKFEDSKKRLKLVNALVDSQKEKLEHEKYRLNLGRTSTYQVLTFEQDYAQALINRLRIENEILAIHAQMKIYGDSQLGESKP